MNPPNFKAQHDDGVPRHVPDSTAAFTVTQAQDLFFALDWHPSDHPPLPDIVAHGASERNLDRTELSHTCSSVTIRSFGTR
jgi:hypothetical protein